MFCYGSELFLLHSSICAVDPAGTDGFCLFPSVPMGMFVGDGRRCFYTRLRTGAIFPNGARASSGIRILKSLRVHLKFR